MDFSAKKPEITAKLAVGLTSNGHHHVHGHHFTGHQSWSHHLPGVLAAAAAAAAAASHSSESGVSDLCSNSPQSDTAEPPVPAKSPIESRASPIQQQQQQSLAIQQQQQQSNRVSIPSPLPAALSAIYGPLAALQQQQQMQQQNGRNIDPAISAATTQLLSNLAAVTNGGKGGKNTRPFKGNNTKTPLTK